MNPTATPLPEPDAAALAASRELSERIRKRIAEAGGWIPFEAFMQTALYEPGLGYYSGGSRKFGPEGDFVTAPELGDFFARAIAITIAPMLEAMERPSILELGAGTGRLAAQLLSVLPEHGVGAVDYRILEPSAELRERQSEYLAGFAPQIEWLESLEGIELDGLILANEVADALPTSVFVKHNGVGLPLGVADEGGSFGWAEGGPDEDLAAGVAALEEKLGARLPEAYRSELNGLLAPWIAGLADVLGQGAIMIVDYGLVRREYYHPDRTDGTLICHYRHRAHADPFVYPGLQDISAWVDFSAAVDAAVDLGLDVAGFTTQGLFVMEAIASRADALAHASPGQLGALRKLVLPGEMGEAFKLMLLTRGSVSIALPGRDLRGRL